MLREKVSKKVNIKRSKILEQYRKGYKLYDNSCTFVYTSYTFPLAGNRIVYTPIQGTKREKYLNHIIYKGKMSTLLGINTSPSNSSLRDRVVSIFRRKKYGSNPSEMGIKVIIPVPTQQIITKAKDQKDFTQEEIYKKCIKYKKNT